MSMSVYLNIDVKDKSHEEIKEIWKRIDYEETDEKVLYHNSQEAEMKLRESDPEKFNYELKQ